MTYHTEGDPKLDQWVLYRLLGLLCCLWVLLGTLPFGAFTEIWQLCQWVLRRLWNFGGFTVWCSALLTTSLRWGRFALMNRLGLFPRGCLVIRCGAQGGLFRATLSNHTLVTTSSNHMLAKKGYQSCSRGFASLTAWNLTLKLDVPH